LFFMSIRGAVAEFSSGQVAAGCSIFSALARFGPPRGMLPDRAAKAPALAHLQELVDLTSPEPA
jgi:hypothetical protein